MRPGDDHGPLSPDQQQELADASQRVRGLVRAGKVAAFDAWSIGAFAAVTLLFGLTSLTALVIGLAMALVARTEFRGLALMRSFDPAGPRLLAQNQLGLMGIIMLYCVWSIVRTLYGPGPDLAGLEAMLGDAQELVTTLTLMVYLGVMVGTAVFQGLMARYYWKRVRLVEEYLRDTPAWVVELQRKMG